MQAFDCARTFQVKKKSSDGHLSEESFLKSLNTLLGNHVTETYLLSYIKLCKTLLALH